MRRKSTLLLLLLLLVGAFAGDDGRTQQQLNVGLELHAKGDLDGALAAFEGVLLEPGAQAHERGRALHNAAAIHHIRGNNSNVAIVELDRATTVCGAADCPVDLRANIENTRGVVLRARRDERGARRAFERALALLPDHGHAAYNLAHMLQREDDDRSAELYRSALRSRSADARCSEACLDRVQIINDLALVLDRLGEHAEAVDLLREAAELAPDSLQTAGNLAIYQRDLGDIEAALESGRRGLLIAPESVPMMHNLALIEQKAGNVARAVELWEAARALAPDIYQPIASLAHYEGYRGNVSGARRLYGEALAVAERVASADVDSLRLQLATCTVPHIYESTEHMHRVHAEYVAALRALLDRDSLAIEDPLHSTGSGALGYYLEYVGYADLPPRRLLASIYWRAAPSLRYVAPFLDERSADERLRVGFLSAFFFSHSVGLLTSGIIEHLDRRRFWVVLLHVAGEPTDDLTARLASSVDDYVGVSNANLDVARRTIAAQRLDVVVFCEIGMHAMTYFLAFSRMARRSVLFWGHAVTSGISATDCPDDDDKEACGGLDYFASSELFENAQAQEDYSERLWLMEGLATRFARPVAPTETPLASIISVEHDRLYLVPQTLYKLHPDFDGLLADILAKDPRGVVAMPEAQLSDWTEAVARRWETTIPPRLRSRLVFFRRLGFADFVRLAQLADVVLDPFPVGGGRSSMEIFSVGTPIVLLENRTSVLQLTRGMYERMRFPCPECVVRSLSEFSATAIALATNATRLSEVRARILHENSALYEDDAVVREWEAFFEYIVRADRPADQSTSALIAREELSRSSRRYVRRGTWGWELVEKTFRHKNDAQPSFADPSFAYMVRMRHPDPRTGESPDFVLGVPAGQDAADTALAFAAYIGAEPVKHRWLATVLQNGASRAAAPVVVIHRLGEEPVEVRLGDDLAQLAAWQGQRLGLSDHQIDAFRDELKRLTPDHDTPEWLRARARRDLLVPARARRGVADGCFAAGASRKKSWTLETSNSKGCVLSIGVTTCKRLAHFQATMRGLSRVLGVASPADHSAICAVVVVDDGSSEDDRIAMAREFPDFHFHLKPPSLKGHAHSMNLLLRLVETPYLLYLEDDWLALDHVHQTHIIDEPLAVLRHASAVNEPLVQVLLNDQSTRGCAYAVPGACDRPGRAGWKRTTTDRVSYSLHEFGTVDPDHQFTYWPGFTLNPAVWSLDALACAHRDVLGRPPYFDPSDKRFEQSFSLQCYDAGLRVAYLPRVSFAHIGVDESAYGLNGEVRPWEEEQIHLPRES